MKRLVKDSLCLLAAISCCVSVLGDEEQETPAYTLDDCIRIGSRNSGTVVGARFDEAIAGSLLMQARSQVMPRLSMGGSYNRLDEAQEIDLGVTSVAMADINSANVQAQVSQVIYPNGLTRGSIRAARKSKVSATWSRIDVMARIKRDIRIGFYDVLLAEETLKVAQESVIQVGLKMRNEQARYREGAASEFDALRSRVQYDNEVRAMMRARNARDVALLNFKRLLNLDGEDFELEGSLVYEPVELDLEELQRRTEVRRPSVRALESAVQARRHEAASARASRLPGLVANLGYTWGNTSSFGAIGGEDWEWHWSAGLAMDWNFWDGGLTSHTVRQKTLEMEKMRAEMTEYRKRARLEVELGYLQMEDAVDLIESRSDDVVVAQRSLELARVRQETGGATYLDFSESNVALRSAQLAYLQAVHGHLSAVANMKYASGCEDLGVLGEDDEKE